MKELSIQEKAKAYDEALSVARKTHQTQPMYRDWLEKMFPELAESEDERIRDMIFNCVYQCCDDGFISVEQRNNAISWLEAQGEKPQRIVSAEAKEAMYDKLAPVRTGPIGFDGEPMKSKPCEQKPAWSEEDESRMNNLCHFLEEYGNQYYGCLTLQGTISWLKSLRPQNTWKPSEEQLDALHDAAVYVDKSMFPYPKGILMKLYKQIKKLREE